MTLLKEGLQSEDQKKKNGKNKNRERTSCVASSMNQVQNSSLSLQTLSSVIYRSTVKGQACMLLCMNGIHNSFEPI